MKAYFIGLLMTISFFANAAVSPYEWERERGRYKLSTKESGQTEYVIKNHTQYDFVLEDNQFLMYSTIHRIILVNNNEAIQKHNRIFISMANTIELTDLRARAINKDGKVVNFDKSNLKELKDEDGNKAYRIFAIEGIEMGSEVEYYFTRKMQASLFDRVFTQSDAPIKASSFLLTCPSHLQFDFKSYLGYPDVKKEKEGEKNIYSAVMADVPAMREEPFSYFDANRKRIEFKLAYNTGRSSGRLYTWDEAGKNFYTRLNTLSKDEEKALEKFYKSLGDKTSDSKEVRIKSLEEKIKTTVKVDDKGRGESVTELNNITKYKIASREGMTKLMLAVFNKAAIATHVVITCSREDVKFDGAFDSWAFLDDYLLYFPETKGFLAPYIFENRYPFVPSKFTANQGLFIEPFAVGELKSGLASVHEIPALGYKLNYDNLNIDVKFSDDLASNVIRQKREFGGYNAAYFTPYFNLMSKEDVTELVDDITKRTAPDAKITKGTANPVSNGLYDNFVLDVDFTSAHFIEKAGPRVLFKVGALIGPQTEMYRDDERLTDVENDFNRLYDRKITIQLPAGYTLKNADDLNFDVTFTDKDRKPFVFKSSYTISGNMLELAIHEYYEDILVPIQRYEDFRKVVNAAADFNKVTLVFEKKK